MMYKHLAAFQLPNNIPLPTTEKGVAIAIVVFFVVSLTCRVLRISRSYMPGLVFGLLAGAVTVFSP